MGTYLDWKYDEYRQVGKDYSLPEEVEVYDTSHARFRDVEAENASLLAELGLGADSSLLDIGCGTGAFAIAAAKRCRRVFGIDVSSAMLERAKKNAREASVANIEFIRAGFLDFQLSAARLDAVTSSYSLHHLPDYWKGEALRRVWSSLKSDGVFFLRDVVMPDDGAAACATAFIDRQEKRGGDFLREDAIDHFRDEFSTYSWVMLGLLERSGFVVEKSEMVEGVVCEYLCKKRSFG